MLLGLLKDKKQPAVKKRLSNSVCNNGTEASDVLLGRKHCSLCILLSSWLGYCKPSVDNTVRSEITPIWSTHHSYLTVEINV